MDKRNQTYWNELLSKYRTGSISKDERYELEKAALDDPFLMDALQGFSENMGDHDALLSDIQNSHLQTKKKKDYSSVFSIAAGFLLLAGVMFILKMGLDSDNNLDQSIAIIDEKESEVYALNEEESAGDYAIESMGELVEEKAPVALVETPKQEPEIKKGFKKNKKKQTPELQTKSDIAPQPTQEKTNNTLRESTREVNEPKPRAQVSSAYQKSEAAKQIVLSNQAPEMASNSGVRTANKNADADEIMADAMDVVIEKTIVVSSMPLVGEEKFLEYVINEVDLFQKSQKEVAQGSVILEFNLNQEAVPYNITITKSLSKIYDNKAIEILKNGGAWSRGDTNEPIVYTINF